MSSSTLDALLDEDQPLDPVTADGLSNHLSMGLIGLARLGADDAQLHRFADGWRERLVDRRPEQHPIGRGDWDQCLGTGRRYSDLLRFFTGAIDEDGVDLTLDEVLGTLIEGVGGAAFHGVIRLAYALEHGRPGDIACGLAYLADVHDPVEIQDGTQSPTGRGMSMSEVLAALADNSSTAGRKRGPGRFSDQFHSVVIDPAFRQIVGRLAVEEAALEQIAAITLALYRSSRDFFALHTVTGSHAVRIALGRVADRDQQLCGARALAGAVAAAYVVIGTPSIDPTSLRPELSGLSDWPAIADAAIASGDVHTIKMTYSCRQEQSAWDDPAYQVTAAEVAGLG